MTPDPGTVNAKEVTTSVGGRYREAAGGDWEVYSERFGKWVECSIWLYPVLGDLHAARSREKALAEENGRLRGQVHEWGLAAAQACVPGTYPNSPQKWKVDQVRGILALIEQRDAAAAALTAAETALGNVERLERWLKESLDHDVWCTAGLVFRADDDDTPVATAETLAGLGEELP